MTLGTMQLKNTLLILLVSFSIKVSAQQYDSTYNELEHLNGLIHQFIYERDTMNIDRNSELILIFLKTDSVGRITSINTLADEKNPGNTQQILRKLTPVFLAEWRSIKNKEKVIELPVYCAGSREPAYLDNIDSIVSFKGQDEITRQGLFVRAPRVFYIGPNNGRSFCPMVMGSGSSDKSH